MDAGKPEIMLSHSLTHSFTLTYLGFGIPIARVSALYVFISLCGFGSFISNGGFFAVI